MNEEELECRRAAISNFISVTFDRVRATSVSDSQCDIHVVRKDGSRFRYGYFHDWIFWRENPVQRMLWDKGFPSKEGEVGFNHEPQYDMIFKFSWNGRYATILDVTDNRTQMESDYNATMFDNVRWRIHELFDEYTNAFKDEDIRSHFMKILDKLERK